MKDIEVLPCGCLFRCEIRDGQRVGSYVPCNKSCGQYRAMLEMALRTNKPVTFVPAP